MRLSMTRHQKEFIEESLIYVLNTLVLHILVSNVYLGNCFRAHENMYVYTYRLRRWKYQTFNTELNNLYCFIQ